MLFNSLTFIAFFSIMLAMYFLPFSWRYKKIQLLSGSYVFYAAWNPPFVVLIIISTVVDWVVAKMIYLSKSKSRRVLWLILSLLVNLGILAYFKYGTFVLDNFISTVNAFGVDYHPAKPSIILPIGISFYTFQTLSYTLDVYRRNIEPSKSFLDFSLFVIFFPQLVAGPIMRAKDFLPQCKKQPIITTSQIIWGVFLLTFGLFQKIVLADGILAPAIDEVYNAKMTHPL